MKKMKSPKPTHIAIFGAWEISHTGTSAYEAAKELAEDEGYDLDNPVSCEQFFNQCVIYEIGKRISIDVKIAKPIVTFTPEE